MVAEFYPDSLLYSLNNSQFLPFFPKQKMKVYPWNITQRKKPFDSSIKCREWVNFIDDLNMPRDQQQRTELVHFVISQMDEEFFKSTLMPVVFKKNFNHFV